MKNMTYKTDNNTEVHILNRIEYYKTKYDNCNTNLEKRIYLNIIKDLIEILPVKVFFVIDGVVITNKINYYS